MSFSNIWDLRRFRMVTKVTLAQKAFSKLTKISTESYNHFSFTVKLLANSMTVYNAAFPIGRKFPIRKKNILLDICALKQDIFLRSLRFLSTLTVSQAVFKLKSK